MSTTMSQERQQREIRFRAWNGHGMDYDVPVVNGKHWSLLQDCAIEGWPLMQYTGLKNCWGQELWEGDLIERCGSAFEVVFKEGSFCLDNDMISAPLSPLSNYHMLAKVTGCVYSSPELLES